MSHLYFKGRSFVQNRQLAVFSWIQKSLLLILFVSQSFGQADDSDSAPDSSNPQAEEVAPPVEAPPILQEEHTWIDQSHSWLYDESQDWIEWFDELFVSEDEEKIKTPPSRFRLGLYSEFNLESDRTFKLVPVVNLSTNIHLPNLERRLRVFVSTQDPTSLPDEDMAESNNELRVGATRDFFKHWSTSIGVKARWPPEAFANVSWSRMYSLPKWWRIYPNVKPFWDSEDGLGALSSVVVDKWRGSLAFSSVRLGEVGSEQLPG